jgi:glycosyltransferase involved in cell wall biosynthesis
MRVLDTGETTVELVSSLSSREPKGDAQAQHDLIEQAQREHRRLIQYLSTRDTKIWVTYHNYYKAPDLIGPSVADALGIPYVLIEATRARKRFGGPWDRFAKLAEQATDAADLVFHLTEHDAEALIRDRPPQQKLVHLPPFLGRTHLPTTPPQDPETKTAILVAGMMRPGDKIQSYALVADTLAALPDDLHWHVNIVGDGPKRPEVEQMMRPFGNKVSFLGQLRSEDMTAAYQSAALFLWPGVNEAFGMVYLEAQAAGLVCVAQDRPGVRDVVGGPHLCPISGGAPAMANAVSQLLRDPQQRRTIGQNMQNRIQRDHLLSSANRVVWQAIPPLLEPKS